MATSTIKSKQDTGWIVLNATYNCRYRCVDGIVFVECKYNGVIPNETRLGTLPSQYKPFDTMRFPNYSIGNVDNPIFLDVSTSGVLTIIGAGNKWINIIGSYPV